MARAYVATVARASTCVLFFGGFFSRIKLVLLTFGSTIDSYALSLIMILSLYDAVHATSE